MYQVIASNQFGKDYKRCIKRHLPIDQLDSVIISLSNGEVLPKKFRTHKLEGVYKNCWECHIQPDWLIIWQIDEELKELRLVRTGSHSDLF